MDLLGQIFADSSMRNILCSQTICIYLGRYDVFFRWFLSKKLSTIHLRILTWKIHTVVVCLMILYVLEASWLKLRLIGPLTKWRGACGGSVCVLSEFEDIFKGWVAARVLWLVRIRVFLKDAREGILLIVSVLLYLLSCLIALSKCILS